ncbi:hypothetical protein KHO57_gp028 [Mycobacterium phage Phabba]|uniref:Uncharacterized protein n=1 Tax=Mycobacterium phage Phabba TaxID=2027899 RepID=A0A249XS86_9CAUD|nr:hypothetical protein KHO57_gp028 [Mycobacterium phage Phabba]ASZ74603.1 hypothetical protein SEA_PHABBA_28 [Mycobacterium phage Phabba]
MNLTGIKVGDRVTIEESQYGHRHGQPYEPRLSYGNVTKVARKYFTVAVEFTYSGLSQDVRYKDQQFEIATGLERPQNPNYTSYRDEAFTEEGWNEELYKREIRKKIRDDHKFHGSGGFDGTLSRLEDLTLLEQVELLAFLDRVKERRATVDLDR